MARGGAASSRGRGKFKVARGGGRHFSRDLDPRLAEQASSEEEESSEEETSSDDDDVAGPSATLAPEMAAMNLKLGNTEAVPVNEAEISRAERKAAKKAAAAKKAKQEEESDSEEESDEEPAKAKAAAAAKAKAQVEQTRKDKEASDKKAAAERYQKLHAQGKCSFLPYHDGIDTAGKTSEAKTDMARLQEVRRRREAAAKQREAEAAEAAREAAEKKEKAKR